MPVFGEQQTSCIHRLDPRGRLAAVVLFAFLVVSFERWASLGWAVVAAGVPLALAGGLSRRTLGRLSEANLFVAFLVLLVPLSTPGAPLVRLGVLCWSREGVQLACRIGVRANAVLLACCALIATLDPGRLGAAMTGLGVPSKLAHVFLFMVRYVEVIHLEYERLRSAMRLRGFRPRCDLHSLRSLGYLIGMLLIRSMDRADRVCDAMKCRGFRGRFHLLEPLRTTRRDAVFLLASFGAMLGLGWIEWA